MKAFESTLLAPQSILAGDSSEFVIALTIGPDYTDGPSRILIDFPAMVGSSRPSLLHQEDHGYMEVYVSNSEVTYTKRNFDMELVDFATREKTSWRGMAQRQFVLDLSAGLAEGDTIEIHWGDACGGYGPGAKVTTVVPVEDCDNTIHVRYYSGDDRGVPDMGRSYKGYDQPVPDVEMPLTFRVLPRPLHHWRLVRKTDKAILLPLDMFWNVTPIENFEAEIDCTATPEPREGTLVFKDKNVTVSSKRLPLTAGPAMDDVFEGRSIYWGDIHTHSAFSNDCIEREKLIMTPADLMNFARVRAGLDFYAVTDHHQPWDVERNKIGREFWNQTIEALHSHNSPGQFLVFPGIEYRCKRGDTAVLFNWIPEYDEIDQPAWTDIRMLWEGLDGKDFISIPHFHNGGGLEQNEWWSPSAEGIEPVIEMFSCHGSYEREDALEHHIPMAKRFRPDRNAAYFLENGHRYGLVCNSDGHKGHVGSNGVTAVFAESLDKNSILAAYRSRHVYGTTNARIRLVFTGNGQLMGSTIPNCEQKAFMIDVTGEAPLKKIDVFRNGAHCRRFIPDGLSFTHEWTEDDAEPSNWYVRVTQKDNHIAYSSPVWYEGMD